MSLLGLFVPEMIQVSEGRTDKSIPEVDLSQAVKIGRLSDGLIRYTFDLSSNQPHVFSNLIVIEHPEHEPMSYITEYHPDRDWLIEKAGNWKAIDYTGYVLTKALDGQVLTVSEYEHGEGDIFKYDPEAGEAGRTACDPLFGWSPGDFTGWVDVGNGSWSNFNTGTSSFSSGDPSGGSWTIIIIKTTQPDDDFSGDGENPSGGGSDLWITRTSCGSGYDPNAILCNGTGNCSQVTAVTSVFCEDECDEEELCDQNPLTTWVAGECECTFGKGENGECVSEAEAIIAELKELLDEDPFALIQIDCDQIENWQDLIQNSISQSVKDKINDLQNKNSSWFDDWAIQSLNGAGGTVINMDYFSVNLSLFPINPLTGQTFNAPEFLDYFRRNINNFVEGSTFEPYCETSFLCDQETELWNSNDPTGAIIYIDIPFDDGVVICSEYASDYWHFITLEAPGAGNHPVSGTRQFGFEQNPDGSYDFFTRGVDRIDSRGMELLAGSAIFGGADDLWTSFQNGLSQFVNSNVNEPVKNRPDWQLISEVLSGEKPISDLGCD